MNELLLREIVGIAGEFTSDRILRATNAASRRLIKSSAVAFTFDGNFDICYSVSGEVSASDHEVITLLAKTAELALINSKNIGLTGQLQISDERNRIARDLHDKVLQRLFATGLSLEGALRKAVVEDVIESLRGAISDLDDIVGQIRSTVHSLKSPLGSLRQKILHEIETARNRWKMSIDFNLSGAIDATVPKEDYEDILAAVQEMLNNCGKYNSGESIQFDFRVEGITLTISTTNLSWENPKIKFGEGLDNLAARANKYGGELSFSSLSPGVKVTWQIPI